MRKHAARHSVVPRKVSIPDRYQNVSLDEVRRLQRKLMLGMLKKRASLSGSEIRFLRERMNMSRWRLSRELEIDLELLEAWEQDSCPITIGADVRLRLLCASYYGIILNVHTILAALVTAGSSAASGGAPTSGRQQHH